MLHILLALGLHGPLPSPPVSAAALPAEDPTALPMPARAVKLGLLTTPNGVLPTLGFEWLLCSRLSLQTRAGYSTHSFTEYALRNVGTELISLPYARQVRQLATDAQVRYHFQGQKRPLTGWYAAAGGVLTYAREAANTLTGASDSRKTITLRPQVQAGRQWIFADHWLLDVFLGLGLQQQREFAFAAQARNYWDFSAANGVQVGYTF